MRRGALNLTSNPNHDPDPNPNPTPDPGPPTHGGKRLYGTFMKWATPSEMDASQFRRFGHYAGLLSLPAISEADTSHLTLHTSRFTLHASRVTLHASRFTLHASRFTLHFTLHTHASHSPSTQVRPSSTNASAGLAVALKVEAWHMLYVHVQRVCPDGRSDGRGPDKGPSPEYMWHMAHGTWHMAHGTCRWR